MAYTPENNPYIPGDPYSYDLKWLVARLKETITQASTAINNATEASSSAAQAISTANSASSKAASALTAAQNAIETANSASSEAASALTAAQNAIETAQNAVETATEALAAADKTVITVNCDYANNTAEIISDLTFEQIIKAAQQNNILLRLSISTDNNNVQRMLVYPTLQYFSASDYWSLTADLIRSDGTATTAPSRIYIDKAMFTNSKTGYYQRAQILVSQ